MHLECDRFRATPTVISDSAHISAITQLVLAERECRDMGRWERMKSCYHADGFVRISWFQGNAHDFVDASRAMAERQVLAKHRLGPGAVRIAGHRAVATMVIAIDIPAEIKGVEVMLASTARVFYRAELKDGAWKLCSFEACYMRDDLPGEDRPQSVEALCKDIYGWAGLEL